MATSGSVYGAHIEVIPVQIHPLVTVKKAASVLGMDKNLIREKLNKGEIQGERRWVGDKEKWFLYAGAVENLLEKQRLPELTERTERISVDGMEEVFDQSQVQTEIQPDGTELEVSEPGTQKIVPSAIDAAIEFETIAEQLQSQAAVIAEPVHDINEILQALTIEFAHRLAEERQTILRLELQLAEKTEIVKQLPMLEESIAEGQSTMRNKDVEITNLRTQVSLLQSKVEHLQRPWWKRLFTSPVGQGQSTIAQT